jgi:chromosome segregation protein
MHIKKLEIAGFKSFVDRTVVHFDHDVIGIVGPNGCGKSNIVDSIRWCMGEQSAKHLRGKSMEDVIFNGSESRGPAGLAEVTITFDNSDPVEAAQLPPEFKDYPEIAVTRRLYRDGTSEYLVNKTQVRLRDITELFLGTGVGTKAYSIVEQGRIGQIVSARPEDRRLFLEEAAGITKYKQRRKQAERKMELTRQNLLRITDIVNEIERNRNTLKRQVAKAERFVKYREELEDLELHERSHELLRLTVLRRVASDALTASRAAGETARAQLLEAEARVAQAREEASGIEDRAKRAANDSFRADNEVTSLVAEINQATERLEHLGLRLTSGQAELEVIAGKMASLQGELETLDARIADLDEDERARQADAETEAEQLSGLREGEQAATAAVLAVRERTSELSRESAATGARIDGLVQRVADSRTRQDRLVLEQQQVEEELASLAARERALEEAVTQLAEGKRLTAEERVALDQLLNELRSSLLEKERALDAAKNELMLKRNRLRALEDLHRRLEGVGTGVRALLSKDDDAIVGMVADRIEAPEHLTHALAGLLGEQLQYVIVKDPERGLALLEDLQRSKRGRAHIVPARPIHVAGRRAARVGVEGVQGIVGPLAAELRYAPEDEALVHTLIGDAVVVETPALAMDLVRRSPGLTAVALDGTVVRPNGVVSGGGGDDVASAMVEQKRELRVLAEEVQRLTAVERHCATEHANVRAQMTEVETSLDRARQEAHEGELAHMTAEKDLARTKSDRTRVAARSEVLAKELADLVVALEAATQAEAESRAQLDELSSRIEQARAELEKAEEKATEWRERTAAQTGLLTERRVRLAQVREQLGASRAARSKVESTLQEFETRSRRLDQELLDAASTYGETAARIMVARESLVAARQTAATAHEHLDEANALLDQVRQGMGETEQAARALREELGGHEDACHKHEMALTGLERDYEHLITDVKKRFRGLELARVVGDYHLRPPPDAELRARIHELAQLIDRMGPVNLDAKAEYEDAEKRFTDLDRQKVDIEKALVELERAIKHMNKESRRRFKETFDTVNALFKDTFVQLFKGGRAELKLTNPEDMLQTGVDIIAMPPGKKLSNIELMSGGEKALTAVALIFAIFRHRPSPFCVLDEVDAPLDEANVARYNEAIRAMTDHSQFILITHIKKTMQSVDVLYGVTMGEPGVSRVVSVKVNENAVARSDSRANSLAPEAQQNVA